MSLEILQVLLFAVALPVLPEPPEDLEPAFAQATQRTGMAVPTRAFAAVIGLGPSAGPATQIGPQMHGATQKVVARVAQMRFAKPGRFGN